MTATLSPSAKQQFFDANGNPLVGGKLYSYIAGTTSPVVTYVDSEGVTTNTNPIILDSRGEANVWLGTGSFKFKLVSATDVEIWTVDNIPGAPASNAALVALAASNGSSLVGFLQSGTGAVATTVQAKLRESVSVKDFGAVGDGVTDDTAAINAAITASRTVLLPAGNYIISSPILMSLAQQKLIGVGKGSVNITAKSTFAGTTIGGSTGSPMIWYQPSGTWNVNSGWVQGGEISGITLNAAGYAAEGVRINRVVESMVFRDLEIVNAGIGVNGTGFGWGTTFQNCYIHDNSIGSIRLSGSYNGCSIQNCFLYGGALTTQVHLDVDGSALGVIGNFGISMTGGAIEGCLVGARIVYSSVSFNGVDFEVCSQNFIQARGYYTGTYPSDSIVNACPPCTAIGCTFVGVPAAGAAPYVGGIVMRGGEMVVSGCYFINSGSAPSTYALNGVATGDQLTNYPAPCITSINNAFPGWAGFQWTGTVFKNEVTDYRTGTWTPTLNSWTNVGTPTFANCVWTKIGRQVTLTFNCIAGTSISSTVGTSTITGLPFAPSEFATGSMMSGAPASLGSVLVGTAGGGTIYPNTSGVITQIVITVTYNTNS